MSNSKPGDDEAIYCSNMSLSIRYNELIETLRSGFTANWQEEGVMDDSSGISGQHGYVLQEWPKNEKSRHL